MRVVVKGKLGMSVRAGVLPRKIGKSLRFSPINIETALGIQNRDATENSLYKHAPGRGILQDYVASPALRQEFDCTAEWLELCNSYALGDKHFMQCDYAYRKRVLKTKATAQLPDCRPCR